MFWGDVIVDGIVCYLVVVLLWVLCSCDDGPLFAGLKWEYYYLLCGVFAPSAVCFVYFSVFIVFGCGCCFKVFGFSGCVICALGGKW